MQPINNSKMEEKEMENNKNNKGLVTAGVIGLCALGALGIKKLMTPKSITDEFDEYFNQDEFDEDLEVLHGEVE